MTTVRPPLPFEKRRPIKIAGMVKAGQGLPVFECFGDLF